MIPIVATIGGKSTWYLTRGSGVVSLVLLTASVVLGVLTSGRWESRRWPRFVLEGLHRNISLAVLVFLVIHIATTVIDGFVPVGWVDAIIPFRAGYRPVWVGLGALAFDCLLAITITSLLRLRIGHQLWRSVHWLAYACWPIAFVHGLGTGTDTPERWMIAIDAIAVLAVLLSVMWRIHARRPEHPVAAPLAYAATALVPLAMVAFAWHGPLQTGWSSHGARLGGPPVPSIVPGTVAPGTGTAAAPSTLTLPADLTIDGTRSLRDDGDVRHVVISGRSAGATPIEVRIELTGRPDQSGGVSMDGGQISVGPVGAAPIWTGPVTGLAGTSIDGRLSGPGGAKADITAQLTIDRASEQVHGTVHLTARQASSGTNPGDDARRTDEGD